MEAVITALQAVITAEALWGVLAAIVGLIGVVFLFVLGLHFLRKTTKGASKGKLKF